MFTCSIPVPLDRQTIFISRGSFGWKGLLWGLSEEAAYNSLVTRVGRKAGRRLLTATTPPMKLLHRPNLIVATSATITTPFLFCRLLYCFECSRSQSGRIKWTRLTLTPGQEPKSRPHPQNLHNYPFTHSPTVTRKSSQSSCKLCPLKITFSRQNLFYLRHTSEKFFRGLDFFLSMTMSWLLLSWLIIHPYPPILQLENAVDIWINIVTWHMV